MNFILFSILFVFVNGGSDSESLCAGRNATSKPVIDYCISHNGSLENRCCFVLNSNKILAIDLTELNLDKIPDTIQYVNLISVNVVDLRLNSQLKFSLKDDFLGMQYLNYLLLPEHLNCPGEKDVWQIIDKTTNPIGIACINQKDFCINSTDKCVQSRSYCSTNGPNHYLCLCKSGYYGYKCLREGIFPTGIFYGTTICLTGLISVVFYWTHRRHVIKKVKQ